MEQTRGDRARAAVVADRCFRLQRNKMPRASIPEPRPRYFDADHALAAPADPAAIACGADRMRHRWHAASIATARRYARATNERRKTRTPIRCAQRTFFRYLDAHRKCGEPLRSASRDVTNNTGADIRIGIGIEVFCGRGFSPDAVFSDRCEAWQLLKEKRRG